MKLIVTVFLITIAPTLFGQGTVWLINDDEHKVKTRLDTVRGRIMYDDLYTNFPTILEGVRIDSIESIYGMVSCPDEEAGTYFGCAAIHYGWRDKRRGYRYVFTEHKEVIQNKQVIHFTPK